MMAGIGNDLSIRLSSEDLVFDADVWLTDGWSPLRYPREVPPLLAP